MMRRMKVNPVPWNLPSDIDSSAWKQLDSLFSSNDSRYPIHPHHFVTPTERLEIILCHQSFLVRVSDLCLFIERCPPEALKDNFQLIVDSIFSHRNREQAWDLRSMRRADHPREATAVFKLLAPNGPLMTLALRLMDDHNFLLEFPLEGLPHHLKQKLTRLDIPPFFANKVSVMYDLHQQCNVIHHLALNPFEYYVFSFGSINLLGLNTGRSTDYLQGWAVLQDTLYTNLLEEYLIYFFPCDGSGVPNHNFNYSTTEAVFLANSLLRQNFPKKNIYGFGMNYGVGDIGGHGSEENMPKLFKSSILQDQSGPNVTRDNIYHATHPSAYKEVWRSETILHCFIELWMCGPEDFSEQTDGFTTKTVVGPLAYGGLPSVEVVKSVRMLVRHLHFFINCVSSHANHPMDDIRRNSYPVFQRKLYKFLRYTFQYWPLDNSFRIVYETWLSYIQPWRYLQFERKRTHQGNRDGDAPIDRRWFNFLMENILFYTKLFSNALLRLERIDLSATKNALMFYRIAKVLTSQESLKNMLIEIEIYIQTYLLQSTLVSAATAPAANSASGHGGSKHGHFSTPATGRGSSSPNMFFGGSRVSPIHSASSSPSPTPAPNFNPQLHHQEIATSTSAVKVAHLKQLLKEFENPSYIFEPLFSEENKRRISRLLVSTVDARDNLLASAARFTEARHKSQSFMQWIMGTPSPTQMAIQNATERTKAANHLDFAKNQFSLFFDITIDDYSDSPRPNRMFSNTGEYSDLSFELNGRSGQSETNGRKAILPADVMIDDTLTPIGNPDLTLIRSDEIAVLVRLMNFISTKLNDVFCDRLQHMYFVQGWTGRVVRSILAEPKEYYVRGLRGLKKSERRPKYLPPRINLRFCASYYTWCYVFIACVLACCLGLSPSEWVILPIFFYSFFVTFRAMTEPINKWGKLYEKHIEYESLSLDEGDNRETSR